MKISAFCLCSVLILTAPGVMAQQGAEASVTAQQGAASGVTAQQNTVPNQSWDLLRQLRAGERLLVERKTV